MSKYKISGVWKNSKDVITHYAVHLVHADGIERAKKTSKAKAIQLLESNNSAVTWVWSYKYPEFRNGEIVTVVNGSSGKYLRSNPDSTTTDNLAHLIDYDWILS